MGDNYCDAVNNRAFCNYDGGDCCQSTVKTKKVCGILVPQNKLHPSGKEMMLDLVLVTLINNQCLLPNFGVTHSLGINPTSQMWAFFLFLVTYPLGIPYFLTTMHPVEVACCLYQASTFTHNHFYLEKARTEYTVEYCCTPWNISKQILLLLCVQPYITGRQIVDSTSKRVGVFRLHQ